MNLIHTLSIDLKSQSNIYVIHNLIITKRKSKKLIYDDYN